MKNSILTIALIITSFVSLRAQTPEAFNYQAVARNSAGVPMNNQNIGIEITILQNGTSVYSESHTVTTNQFGLFTLKMGDGVSSQGDFSIINWSAGTYTVEIGMDENGGSSYTTMGGYPLLTVPYAMHAKTAENTFSGDYNDLNNQPVIPSNTSDLINNSGFITSPDDADADATNEIQTLTISNDTVFLSNGGNVVLPATAIGFNGSFTNLTNIPAGLSDGDDNTQLTEAQVDAYANNNGYLSTEVDGSITNELQVLSISNDTIFLTNGGYAVLPVSSSFSGSFADLSNVPAGLSDGDDNTQLTETQVDAYANNNGYLSAEIDGSTTNELQTLSLNVNQLTISNGNTVNLSSIDDQVLSLSGTTLSISNGNSLNISSAIPSSYTNISNTNGQTTVDVDAAGTQNKIAFKAYGVQSMLITSKGIEFPGWHKNIFLGKDAGIMDSFSGNKLNVCIGYNAGMTNVHGKNNVGVGAYALKLNTGGSNSAFGFNAMATNATGMNNTAIGLSAMYSNTTGNNNTALGYAALQGNTTGSENVAIGYEAYKYNTGDHNVIIGFRAGRQTPVTSSGNVFIGYKAGYYEAGSNKLVIGNNWNGAGAKLIYGDFSTGKITIEKVLRLPPSVTPTNPETGDIYVNSNGHIYCYLSGTWKQLDN